MARKTTKIKRIRVPLTLVEPTYRILEKLVETGGYGNSPTDAVRSIVTTHLQNLDQRGKIDLFGSNKDAQT